MCICVNCQLIDRCKTYHWVEKQHQQPHLTQEPDFKPRSVQIQYSTVPVSVNSPIGVIEGIGGEYDVIACESLLPDQGKWQRLMKKLNNQQISPEVRLKR